MKTLLLCAAFSFAALTSSAPPPSALVAPPGQWQIDSGHSSVLFKVMHAKSAWFYGAFAGIKGSFTLDADKLEAAKIEVTIDAGSVATRDDKRDQHLRGPDFFDAKQYPEITFASTKVQKKGDAFAVTGDLTLRGITKPVTATVQHTGEGEFFGKRIGYETTFTVKRSDFGMEYGLDREVLGDEVTLIVAIEGVQPEAK